MNTTRNTTRLAVARRIGRTRGLSMVELMCTVSVALTAAGASMEGMKTFSQGNRLRAATSQLESQIQLARSSAAALSQTVRFAIQPLDQGSCTLVHTGPKDACQCGAEGAAVCNAPGAEVLMIERHDARTGVRLITNRVSIAFSGSEGTATPTATIKLTDSTGRSLHQVVNVMGRTRTCSPAAVLSGVPAC